MNTRRVDHLRQGVESTTGRETRSRSTLPTLSTEVGSSFMTQSVFGQPKTFPDNTSFVDLADFDPAVYLDDEDSSQVFPAILGNVSIRDPLQMDGVLEPLSIRDKISLQSTYFPIEAHDIKGVFAGGNYDPFMRSDQITQDVPNGTASVMLPFVDSDDIMGNTVTSSIKIPGIFT